MKFLWEETFSWGKSISGDTLFSRKTHCGGWHFFRGDKHFGGDAFFEGDIFLERYAFFRGYTFFGGDTLFEGGSFFGKDIFFVIDTFFRGSINFWGDTFFGRDTFFGGVIFLSVYRSFVDENFQDLLIFNTLHSQLNPEICRFTCLINLFFQPNALNSGKYSGNLNRAKRGRRC